MTTPSTPVPDPLLVFVTVGTDHHPFDRVVTWVSEWAKDHDVSDQCFAQYGTSSPPVGIQGAEYVSHDKAQELFRAAKVVITHGGPGTIVEIRQKQAKPIVVPRRSDLGEHVDDHQVKFARHIARTGLVDIAETSQELRRLLDELAWSPRRVVAMDDDAARVGLSVEAFAAVVDPLIAARRP